jgi:hypothetical protein
MWKIAAFSNSTMILSGLIFLVGLPSLLVHSAPPNGTNVPPPPNGLDSNSNYIFIDQDVGNLLNVSAKITFNADFDVSFTGVSFQLNCWTPPPKTPSDLALQQFAITLDIRAFDGVINTWTLTDPQNALSDPEVASLQRQGITNGTTSDVIPAGSSLTITLENDDDGIITAAGFSANIGGRNTSTSIPVQNGTAPVVGFTFIIAGEDDGSQGVFSGGNGTLTYFASNAIGPVNTLPDGFLSFFSLETGNTVYGELPSSRGTLLKQSWGVSSSS